MVNLTLPKSSQVVKENFVEKAKTLSHLMFIDGIENPVKTRG